MAGWHLLGLLEFLRPACNMWQVWVHLDVSVLAAGAAVQQSRPNAILTMLKAHVY